MTTSPAGIEKIKQREGVRLTAYYDSVGIPTIGVGRAHGVQMGDTITMEQADRYLAEDLKTAESAVNKLHGLNQNQFDALVSVCFNIGNGAFSRSSVAVRWNAGDPNGACEAIAMWRMAGGAISKGLVNRRISEMEQFKS